jgi:hypothetical protein
LRSRACPGYELFAPVKGISCGSWGGTGHGIGTTDRAAIDKAFDDLLRQVSKERLKTSEVTITVSLVEGSEPERCQP